MKRINYFKLLKYMFWKRTKGPIQLIHFVTSRCNAKCQHCFYWKNLNQKNDLSLAEIEKITKHLPELYYLLISGGEPFLRKDLADIIIAYYKNTPVVDVAIPTNGLLKNKIIADCKKILKACPGISLNIVVSLDGPKEVHDSIRQVPGCYEKAIKTFSALKALKKANKNLKLSIVSTLMSINQKVMADFYHYVRKNIRPDVYSVALIRSNPRNADLKDVNLEFYKKILNLEVKNLDSRGIKNILRNLIHKIRIKLIIDTIEKQKYFISCYACSLTAVLSEDGNILPCELLIKSVGKIKDFDYNFSKAWASKKADACRLFIKKTKCYCTHECFLRINILFNPAYFIPQLIKHMLRIR